MSTFYKVEITLFISVVIDIAIPAQYVTFVVTCSSLFSRSTFII